MKDKGKKDHLPLYGVGPIIVYGQVLFTAAAIVFFHVMGWEFAEFELTAIPFLILGIILIVFGFYLNFSAKHKSKLFENVAENKLITDGVYGIVRNPVYSAVLLACTGAVMLTSDLILIVAVPLICWAYVTVFVMLTEEKWLRELYGQEYEDYCKRVNRCIPWFAKKSTK